MQVISCQIDPHLELAEIHRRVIEEGGPALLFNKIKGSTFPVATNLFGTKKRVELAFGKDPERFIKQVAEIPHKLMPPSLQKLWGYRELVWRGMTTGLKRVSSAPVLEMKQLPPKGKSLPLLTTWPLDGGPFITLPLVYTEHPETHQHNLGMYRIQRFDDEKFGLHCQIGKGGGFHLQVAKERREKLPVNIFLGGPPALILSAIAPLPENVPELMLASFVAGEKLKTAKVPETRLPIIGECEFLIAGEVDPNEMHPEGPFGDHYGYYSLEHDYPLLRAKAIYHRKDAIYPATVVGKPAQEDYYIGDYLQKLLSPLFPLVMPSVVDLWSYGDTGYHALAAARVKERYKKEALTSGLRILGEGQLALTKFLLLVDKPVELQNFKALLQHVLERTNPQTDLYILGHTSMDTLDYTGPKVNEGSKGILLGCGEPIRALPYEFSGELPRGILKALPYCPGCLVVSGPDYKTDSSFGKVLSSYSGLSSWPLIILVDDAEEAVQSDRSFLWHTFTRFNPATDITCSTQTVMHNHLGYSIPLVIDSRMKPWYPGVVECDEDTRKLVDSRWHEYFQKSN